MYMCITNYVHGYCEKLFLRCTYNYYFSYTAVKYSHYSKGAVIPL